MSVSRPTSPLPGSVTAATASAPRTYAAAAQQPLPRSPPSSPPFSFASRQVGGHRGSSQLSLAEAEPADDSGWTVVTRPRRGVTRSRTAQRAETVTARPSMLSKPRRIADSAPDRDGAAAQSASPAPSVPASTPFRPPRRSLKRQERSPASSSPPPPQRQRQRTLLEFVRNEPTRHDDQHQTACSLEQTAPTSILVIGDADGKEEKAPATPPSDTGSDRRTRSLPRVSYRGMDEPRSSVRLREDTEYKSDGCPSTSESEDEKEVVPEEELLSFAIATSTHISTATTSTPSSSPYRTSSTSSLSSHTSPTQSSASSDASSASSSSPSLPSTSASHARNAVGRRPVTAPILAGSNTVSHPLVPKSIAARTPNTLYRRHDGGVMLWSGSRWRCIHNRSVETCRDCGGASRCEHDRLRSTCRECGGSQICEHDRIRSYCRDCAAAGAGGGGLCGHNRIRAHCKPCGGSIFCEHDRVRAHCRECGGVQICEHDRIRAQCTDCGGSQICEHSRQRQTCRDCGGVSRCEHDRIRSTCRECGGVQICEHDRIRSKCRDCAAAGNGGASFCEHDRIRTVCRDCAAAGTGGATICEHDRIRSACKECGGSQICEHDRIRYQCIDCGGDGAKICKLCRAQHANPRYKPHCARCQYHLNPEHADSRRFLTKEAHLYRALKAALPSYTFTWDQRVVGGCSRRRPDFLFDCLTHCVIVECDEYRHERDDYMCEDRRTMELFGDLGNRPLVLIRFNPDDYVGPASHHASCFHLNAAGNWVARQTEWDRRFVVLLRRLRAALCTVPERELTEIKLFYGDGEEGSQENAEGDEGKAY